MTSIYSTDHYVHFNETCYQKLNEHLVDSNYSKIFLLVDTNTHQYCLAPFLGKVEGEYDIEVIEIEAGEHYKNIETCLGVWEALSSLDGDRKSVIINLGGGVVTDLGGFVACTFKRGIDYINVPTSLLAMVDASVGGKTGVDLGNLKNQIGVISSPQMVLIDTSFLDTLPSNQMRSGLAEMLKHGLIQDANYWGKLSDLSTLDLNDLDQLIHQSVVIKNNVVTEDLKEDGIRKTLNYGHTLGHAIESYFLTNDKKEDLLHGEAIAIGMILATYISAKQEGFPEAKLTEIKDTILSIYGNVSFEGEDYEAIIDLLKYDKKNSHGNINFVLLEDVGKTLIDRKVSNELIMESFAYYSH